MSKITITWELVDYNDKIYRSLTSIRRDDMWEAMEKKLIAAEKKLLIDGVGKFGTLINPERDIEHNNQLVGMFETEQKAINALKLVPKIYVELKKIREKGL